jgi:hypothetical protein
MRGEQKANKREANREKEGSIGVSERKKTWPLQTETNRELTRVPREREEREERERALTTG